MFALGLATAVAYWPGFMSPAVTPRFAALSIVAAILLLWRAAPIPFSRTHLSGALLVAWAALSLTWSPVLLDSIAALWQIALLPAICFCLGSQSASLRPFFIGATIGLAVSSLVSVAQALGWHGLPDLGVGPSGLFVNGNYMAEAAALILIIAVVERTWWAAVALLPAFLLPNARGALLAAGIALGAYLWRRSIVAVGAVLVACVVVIALASIGKLGMAERFDIWGSTLSSLNWSGHGIGSFWWVHRNEVYPDGVLEHAHNDFLELVSDLGPVGVALFAWFAWELRGPLDAARLVLIGLAVEAVFAFPIHMPVTLAVGAVCAGFAARHRAVLRPVAVRGRRTLSEGLV